MLAMYLFDGQAVINGTTGLGNGMSGVTNPSQPPIPSLDQPWLLLASIAMCAMSFFLLHEAVKFLEWVTPKDKEAPNPKAGIVFTWVISIAMVVFSCIYWIFCHSLPHGVLGPEVDSPLPFFHWVISNRPSELATGPLLGSLVPAAMAIFKFVMAGFIMRSTDQETLPLSRSSAAPLAGAIFALIQLTGSIATLIMFFFWIQKP